MKLNKVEKSAPVFTHNGAKGEKVNYLKQLERTILSCFLWEDSFYENGEDVASRIKTLVPKIPFESLAELAIRARSENNIRHAPLLICAVAVSCFDGKKVGDMISQVIQRPDEMGELISIYWKLNGKKMIPRQMKIGIARAFKGFNEYQLAKYNSQKADVKLRDVVFLCHIRAGLNKELGSRLARLVNKSEIPLFISKAYDLDRACVGLESPETWENRLSRGEDKKKVFTELLEQKKLGGLALLRNLRNMEDSGVSSSLVKDAILNMNTDRVLPFRFVSAFRNSQSYRYELETAMFACAEKLPKLKGETVLLVDVSGSMGNRISSKSDLNRCDAAGGLAILLREICEDVTIYPFENDIHSKNLNRGFYLSESLRPRGGTNIGRSVESAKKLHPKADRIIVITDEQSSSSVGKPVGKGYMINVGHYRNGVSKQGDWETISGFSESVVTYIAGLEALKD